MLKLAVASFGPNVSPSILFRLFDEIANLHATSSFPAPSNARAYRRAAGWRDLCLAKGVTDQTRPSTARG